MPDKNVPQNASDEGKQAEEVEVAASQDGAEKAEEKTEVTIGESPKEEDEPTKEDLDKKALADKVSIVDKRNQQLRDDYDILRRQQEAVLRRMNPVFAKNPELYEEWRQGILADGIEDPGTHEQLYGSAQSQQTSTQQATTQQEVVAPQQPAISPAQVAQVIDQRIEDREGWKSFVKNHPEFDLRYLDTDEKKQEKAHQWQRIAAVAATLKAYYPHYTADNLFELAYNSLPENREQQIKQAEEKGEIKGRQGVLLGGTGTTSGLSGSVQVRTGPQTVPMTRSQKETYDRLKANNPKVAERYAREIQNQPS